MVNEQGLFSGRIAQIAKAVDAVTQRGTHAILFGERGVGKTSLSNVLTHFLKSGPDSMFVTRVNCDASDDFTSVWKKALTDISIIRTRQGTGFTNAPSKISESVAAGLPDKLTPDDIRRTLTPLSEDAILVVIFDEFDRIEDRATRKTMADTIKLLSDYPIDTTIFLIGVADSVDELIQEHQSIERAVIQIPMPRMSTPEIKEIVQKGLERLEMNIDAEALDQIANLSQGLPYITHLTALHSVQDSLKGKSLQVSVTNVAAGIQKAVDEWQHSIKSACYNATKSQQPDTIYREVLLACAHAEKDELGYFSAAAVRAPLRKITDKNYDIPNFSRHLKEFSEAGRGNVLQQTGAKRRLRYRFSSPLIQPYVLMTNFLKELSR